MEKEYVQALIIYIGGARLPHESMKGYLARVSLDSEVDFYSVRDAYYTGRASKNALAKFEKAAQSARRSHDLIAYVRIKLAIWEKHPELYRPWISATRSYLEQMDQIREAPSGSDEPCGDRDGPAEAAAARLAAAGAKA